MRRVITTLGVFALVAAAAVTLSARQSGQTTRPGEITIAAQRPGCAELPDLHAKLARLQQDLDRLQDALEQAKQSGNRERAAQIMREIRRVKTAIEDVQHKIRRLSQVCGTR